MKTGGGSVTAPLLTASSTRLIVGVPAGATSGKVYVQVASVKSNGMRFKVIAVVNQAPSVDAGEDQSVTLPDGAVLSGTVSDDGLPTGASLTTTWSQLSGPGTVSFGDRFALSTPATFSSAGTYLLRL